MQETCNMYTSYLHLSPILYWLEALPSFILNVAYSHI